MTTALDATGWLPCSDRSRERLDPLEATGSRGLQWFLIENAAAWGTRALLDPPFDPDLGRALVTRIEAAGLRPLAIRRTGRERTGRPSLRTTTRADAGSTERKVPSEAPQRAISAQSIAGRKTTERKVPFEPRERAVSARSIGSDGRNPHEGAGGQRWRWAFVDSRPGFETVRWGEVDDPHELLQVPLDGSTGVASDRPVFCVCAHARHDQCCAVRGRQVVTTLAAAFPEETWECSHLGGDRFAGTMVLFPHGLYYGRVDDGDATRVAEAYLDGRVVEEFHRGRSSLTHPVQAAQHHARLEFGDDRIDAYPPLEEEWHDGGRFTVRLAGSDESGAAASVITVELAEALSEPLLSTCSATRTGRVRQWELLSITAS